MELYDLAGRKFTINDIEGSIGMVCEFLGYEPFGGNAGLQRLDEQRQVYWQDFLEKLQLLRQQQNT